MPAYVYAIAADNGEVKVGFSSTPYARISKVKRDYGKRRGFASAWLIGYVETPFFLDVESDAIERLLPYATGGEWFRCDPQQAMQEIISAAEDWSQHPGIAWINP